MRVEPLDRRAQVRSEALVVGDDLAVGAELAYARRVEAADDRDPLAARRHEERALPRAVRAGDKVEARILVSSVSRASVSQRPTSCSRRIPAAWSSFSWMSTSGAVRIETLAAVQCRRTASTRFQLTYSDVISQRRAMPSRGR